MPRESDRTRFLRLYEQEVEEELQILEDELDLELEMELENELLSMDEFDDDSDTSISSLTSSSLSSLTSTDSSLSSITSTDNSSNSSSDTELFDDEPEPDDYMDTLDQLLPLVLSQRYLVKRIPTLKSRDFVTRVLPQLNEYDFKEQYRMFHRSFFRILERIQDHPIFHTGTESRPQESPQFQLQVALKRFGTEGSSASSWSTISKQFGIGKGTVGDYTSRVTIALMSLWNPVVSWKTKGQKREMRERLINKGYEVNFYSTFLIVCIGF